MNVELESSPAAAAVARAAVERVAGGLAPARLKDLKLLVSELVTNAVRHAGLDRGERIRLVVAADERVVRVEVHDPGRGFEPREPVPDVERVAGWGLFLVAQLADRWGVDGAGRGSRVWFELAAA